MAQFNSLTAALKHNHGMDKSDLEQGFERLDSSTDRDVFTYSQRSPERQGWRNTPDPMDQMMSDMWCD